METFTANFSEASWKLQELKSLTVCADHEKDVKNVAQSYNVRKESELSRLLSHVRPVGGEMMALDVHWVQI